LRSIAQDAHETYLRVRAGLRAVDDDRPLERVTSEHELPPELREELSSLHDQMRELAQIGARLGDAELGLVLLDGVVDGIPGTLCWKIGEDTVRTWFPLGGRYEDRRPLPPA
jgi:hypothetical protein